MKKTIRYASYLLAFVGLGAVEGCGGDDEEEKKDVECYECTYDSDTYVYCFEDKEYWNTRSQFEAFIEYLEEDGYVCVARD